MPNTPDRSTASTRLSELRPGESSTITAIVEDSHRRRLLELGFVPGTHIGVERRAPLGDPTVYVIRGSRVALRRRLADLITTSGPGETAPTGGER